jgi:hypothetical protein
MSVFGRALPMVVGKRLAPPAGTAVRVEVPDAGLGWTVQVGDDGRAAQLDEAAAAVATPTTTVALSPEDFVLLAGGRRGPEATAAVIEGDEELGRRLLTSLAVTP